MGIFGFGGDDSAAPAEGTPTEGAPVSAAEGENTTAPVEPAVDVPVEPLVPTESGDPTVADPAPAEVPTTGTLPVAHKAYGPEGQIKRVFYPGDDAAVAQAWCDARGYELRPE